MKQLAENYAQLRKAQFKFDDWLELVTDEQVYEIGRNTSFPLHPSHYWTHMAGQKFVGFIGRVEYFEVDFQEFLTWANLDQVEPRNANVEDLKGGTVENPFGYRYVDRMSRRSIAKINKLFQQDFELFEYQQLAP